MKHAHDYRRQQVPGEGERLAAPTSSTPKLINALLLPTRPQLETTDKRLIAAAIQELNPGVCVALVNDNTLFISVPIDQLQLPEPFYYNQKHGITNKNQTVSGIYTDIRPVVVLSTDPHSFFQDIKSPWNIYLETTNNHLIAAAIQRLNPGVRVALLNANLLSISVPIDQLQLPEPFYYDEMNRITNKDSTALGIYTYIHPVVNLSADPHSFFQDIKSLWDDGIAAIRRLFSS